MLEQLELLVGLLGGLLVVLSLQNLMVCELCHFVAFLLQHLD